MKLKPLVVRLNCFFTSHLNKKIWEGKGSYEGKRNKEPLYFKGEWRVLRCLRCNEESYQKIEIIESGLK